MSDDLGRVPSGSGSRPADRAAERPAPSGFDPSRWRWEPIATAPRDREIMAGKWHGAVWARDITRWDGDGWWQMRQIPPTHWCEIQMPPPPASGMDAAKGGRDRNGLDPKDDSPSA